MEIASKYEIAAANLAIALQTDTVSVEQRSELRAAIGSSIDKLVDALNMITWMILSSLARTKRSYTVRGKRLPSICKSGCGCR